MKIAEIETSDAELMIFGSDSVWGVKEDDMEYPKLLSILKGK